MGRRRTDPELLVEVLIRQENNQTSVRRLAKLMGWDEQKVRRVVERGSKEFDLPLGAGPGGVIKYWGGERMASNGLYADVARVISTYWGRKEFHLRNISVVQTATAGTRGSGIWTHPDLVVLADPGRRDSPDEARRLHAVEVETKAGFDLKSVYQAHAQGRGADYTWVFGDKSPGVDDEDWKRILWTAKELKVGVVTFTKPGAYGTWTTWLKAERKFPTPSERETFKRLAIGARSAELGL